MVMPKRRPPLPRAVLAGSRHAWRPGGACDIWQDARAGGRGACVLGGEPRRLAWACRAGAIRRPALKPL